MHKKFWMVIRGDGSGAGTVFRHDTLCDARREAEMGTRKDGGPYYVLEAVARVELEAPVSPPVTWEAL